MRSAEPTEHLAYRMAISSGKWILALSLLVSAAMRPEEMTGPEMERVLNRYHELRCAVQ